MRSPRRSRAFLFLERRLFNPELYFGRLQELLKDCSTWADVVREPTLEVVYDEQRRWQLIKWRFEVSFRTGERMVAFEGHSRRNRKHYRKVKYRLMQADGTLIFQVDPHSEQVLFDTPLHLHKGPTEKVRLENDHWLLLVSLDGFDFPKMWALVKEYLQDGSVPWRT